MFLFTYPLLKFLSYNNEIISSKRLFLSFFKKVKLASVLDMELFCFCFLDKVLFYVHELKIMVSAVSVKLISSATAPWCPNLVNAWLIGIELLFFEISRGHEIITSSLHVRVVANVTTPQELLFKFSEYNIWWHRVIFLLKSHFSARWSRHWCPSS